MNTKKQNYIAHFGYQPNDGITEMPTPPTSGSSIVCHDQLKIKIIRKAEEPAVHARWIKKVHEWDLGDPPSDYTDYTCSNCKIRVQDKTPFCPFCGAEMNGEEHQCQ